MLQLLNQTPFKASIAVLPDKSGIDTLFVVMKATLVLRPKLALAPEQVPVTMADDYYGDPQKTSLRACSDMHIGKPGTDVLVIGSACAPEGRPVTRMHVAMRVGARQKTILVSGDRVWRQGRPTLPQPFERMPLVWERAFGGFHRDGDRVEAEERNPVGCGFAAGRSAEAMEGLPVPNLEDPESPLEQFNQRSTPLCFAPIAPSWLPRRSFAGTYDASWQRSRAPYLPDDFDRRFFHTALPDFAFEPHLAPGERIQLAGVSPDGGVAFAIPDARLAVGVLVAGKRTAAVPLLETVLIEPDHNRVSLTWRASFPCDRQPLKIEEITVTRRAGEANQ